VTKQRTQTSPWPRFRRPACLLLVIWLAFSWSWIEFTDGVTLAGSALTGRLLATLGLVLIIVISAAVMLSAFRMAYYLAERCQPYQTLLLILPIFAFADWAVSWLTSIIWMGPQGRIDSVLPLGSPALLLMHTPLSYAARLVGFYGLAATLGFASITERIGCK
jgi:hypothetical protein